MRTALLCTIHLDRSARYTDNVYLNTKEIHCRNSHFIYLLYRGYIRTPDKTIYFNHLITYRLPFLSLVYFVKTWVMHIWTYQRAHTWAIQSMLTLRVCGWPDFAGIIRPMPWLLMPLLFASRRRKRGAEYFLFHEVWFPVPITAKW